MPPSLPGAWSGGCAPTEIDRAAHLASRNSASPENNNLDRWHRAESAASRALIYPLPGKKRQKSDEDNEDDDDNDNNNKSLAGLY